MSDWTTPNLSDRGFKHYPPIHIDKAEVRIYESSAADGPHVWVSVTNLGDGTQAIHLPLEYASVLADQLQHVIESHYQLDATDD